MAFFQHFLRASSIQRLEKNKVAIEIAYLELNNQYTQIFHLYHASMILLLSLCEQIVPSVVQQNQASKIFYVTNYKLNCTLEDGKNCPKDIYDSFAFFSPLQFQLGAPFTENEYKDKFSLSENDIIKGVEVIVKEIPEQLNILEQKEAYTINISSPVITITANNPFSASRAFQTLMQLVKPRDVENQEHTTQSGRPFEQIKTQKSAYVINQNIISDSTPTAWRSISLDACKHYVRPEGLKRYVDAASLLKLNVLIINFACNTSFPLHFDAEGLNTLSSGAFSAAHFYDEKDLQELQKYAIQRGVVIVPQLNLPGEALPLKYAGKGLVFEWKDEKSNSTGGILALSNEDTVQITQELIQRLSSVMFEELKIQPILHFSGGIVSESVLFNDEEAFKVLQDENVNISGLMSKYYEKFNKLIAANIIRIYDSQVFTYLNNFSQNNTIIHLTINSDRTQANTQGLRQISSVNLFTHLMHPAGGYHYFWQDTWYDLARQNVFSGATGELGIGGGIIQTGDHCYERSCEQHMFQRSFAACDKLWGGPERQNQQGSHAYESLGCRFEVAGIGNGPLEITAPCPGYEGKQL